jgi:hypothetical protein
MTPFIRLRFRRRRLRLLGPRRYARKRRSNTFLINVKGDKLSG